MSTLSDQDAVENELRLAADHMVETLVEAGIRHVFICPGSTEAAFLHAAAKRNDLEIILTTHEGITVSMADGLARESGQPAVAYLHANVGLTNGLSHLYAAQMAYSPVVVLTGLKQTQIQSRGGFTTAAHPRDFVRQYTKWDWQSLRGADVAFDVARAIQQSTTTPAGPTWVGVSQDLAEEPAPAPAPIRSRVVDATVRPSHEAVVHASELVVRSERPAMVVGGDIARGSAAARDAVLRLAKRLAGPVFVEDRRGFERTVVAGSHPLYAGQYDANRASVAEADLVLFLGARCFTEFEAPTRAEIPSGAAVVHVHADAAEVGKIYGADVAVAGDAGAFAEDLLAVLGESVASRSGHVQAAREENVAIRERFLSREPAASGLASVGQVMSALSTALTADTIVVGDATTAGKALVHAVEGTEARLHTTSSGSLGWGVGAAMGIQLAAPDKHVVGVCGDGAFQFGLPGLWTAARYKIPVTYIVINNAAYAAVGAAIRRYAGDVTERERELVVDLAGPSLTAVAAGFGVSSLRLTSPDELPDAVRGAADTDGPVVIEVMTDPLDLGP